MRAWSLGCTVWEIAAHGGWQANTHFKAEFLQELVRQYQGHKILYADADAVFHQSPEALARLDADIAVHYLRHADGSEELLSGTILLTANRPTLELLARWRAGCNSSRRNPHGAGSRPSHVQAAVQAVVLQTVDFALHRAMLVTQGDELLRVLPRRFRRVSSRIIVGSGLRLSFPQKNRRRVR
jgi:hypothetical protein